MFCFAGHTDVVPVGDADAWRFDPFGGEISDGYLYGRGAVDMKTAIACMVEACERVIGKGKELNGSIAFLITGDEEGPAINGHGEGARLMAENDETIDACIVGEPTNPMSLGEMAKIGRRGSFSGHLVVEGQQGHVAYPHLADNPVPRLVKMLDRIADLDMDDGNDHFQPSNLEITTVDVGNTVSNVIPAWAEARFNVRYNTEQNAADLEAKVRAACRVCEQRLQPDRPQLRRPFPDGARRFDGHSGRGHRRGTEDRARSVDHRWHFRCAVHQERLPRRRIRPDQPDHAQGRRMLRGGKHRS